MPNQVSKGFNICNDIISIIILVRTTCLYDAYVGTLSSTRVYCQYSLLHIQRTLKWHPGGLKLRWALGSNIADLGVQPKSQEGNPQCMSLSCAQQAPHWQPWVLNPKQIKLCHMMFTSLINMSCSKICFQSEVINYGHINFTFSHSWHHPRVWQGQ